MGLFRLLRRLFFGPREPATRGPGVRGPRRTRRRVKLEPLRQRSRQAHRQVLTGEEVDDSPYRFAQHGVRRGGYLDLSRDGDRARLAEFGLPVFDTPEELARWLGRPLGQVAWLIYRFSVDRRPESPQAAHYHYRWQTKRTGGYRLIEAPKSILRNVQHRILRDILDQVSPHHAAHGFVSGRSIATNAEPHVGRRVVLKFDLENFYATVGFNRVVAIFRSLGYSREAALWLAQLTTSKLPANMSFPGGDASALWPFWRRHLPQGAPTSPALANLSALGLDVRLYGLASCFGATYTRYADDLTFSGSDGFRRALKTFIPLATQVIVSERFRVNRKKRKVLQNNQRQVVTGVVVNERLNVARNDYDALKATLHNCAQRGPESQNRSGHPDFAAHLQGRIAHVSQLNPARGAKLLALFGRIDWQR